MSQLETTANGRAAARSRTHRITVTAMLSAVAAVLMFVDFSVPFMPAFIKMDISELPALLASFSIGPWYGVAVCLVKNLINCLRTSTGCVGELSNFMLGAIFTGLAGLIYQRFQNHKSRKGALIGVIVEVGLSIIFAVFAGALFAAIAGSLIGEYGSCAF